MPQVWEAKNGDRGAISGSGEGNGIEQNRILYLKHIQNKDIPALNIPHTHI